MTQLEQFLLSVACVGPWVWTVFTRNRSWAVQTMMWFFVGLSGLMHLIRVAT